MEYPVITYTVDQNDIYIDEAEVLRYLGYSKVLVTEEEKKQIRPLVEEARKTFTCRACYRRFELTLGEDNQITLPYTTVRSVDLTRNLQGCHGIYFFAATIGATFDRLMLRTRVDSMSRAAIFQAIGATAVEDVCDKLCSKLAGEAALQGEKLRPRYSPGYGDFGLENQRGFFQSLCPEKYTGITLNDSLIMSPEKSVTAIIGIKKIEDV